MSGNRDFNVLQHIINYCDNIFETVERFGNDFNTFSKDNVYKNAAAMCLLQIGELTTHFTDDFKNTYQRIPWNKVKALRNVVAHNYGKIDAEILWETVEKDIPELRKYCVEIMQQLSDV